MKLKELAKEAPTKDITESNVGTRLGKRTDNTIANIHEDLGRLEVDLCLRFYAKNKDENALCEI